MTPWLLLDIVLALAVIIAAALYITRPVPEPEGNRPLPRSLQDANEQAREEAFRKLAERARQQEQREASARISRGW